MTPLLQAALGLQNFFRARSWGFCFIGGLALLRWGEPRFTRDVDVSLLCPFGREDEFSAPLLAEGYAARVSDAATFARRNRVLLVQAPDGVPIDIALAALPFEQLAVRRATDYLFEPECALRTCSAEDLVVMKLFAFRARDVADVETVVVRQRDSLDWNYIEEQLTPLAEVKDEPGISDALARLRHL